MEEERKSERYAARHSIGRTQSKLGLFFSERTDVEQLNTSLTDYYRCEESLARFALSGQPSSGRGFFQFGQNTVCYGQLSAGRVSNALEGPLEDVAASLPVNGGTLSLPFDPVQVIENLQREHYEASLVPGREKLATQEWIRNFYYFVRDVLPDPVRRSLQRAYFNDWQNRTFPAWPVDFTVDTIQEKTLKLSMEAAGRQRVPFVWFWPEGAPACLMLTHDVETRVGRDFTSQLMDLDEAHGFKAAFQVIPEKRYDVSDEYVANIRSRGFEFNIHDLNHDGRLYRRREEFLRRAKKINQYAHRYDARGFRAGSMYRIQDWYDAYEFSYDMSVPNVAHLEPKRGGCCTVFPYFVGKILELPLTTCQDYSAFYILRDYSLELWKKQTQMICERHGLVSLLAHPDYLIERRPRNAYERLLEYMRRLIGEESLWEALPGDVDRWWRARSQMKVAARGSEWEITGPESERARLAFAVVRDGELVYEVADKSNRRNEGRPLSAAVVAARGNGLADRAV